jgi:hypothetical protein
MRTDLIREIGGVGARMANCKVIDQDPSSTVDPHFHTVNQFQVVTSGGGSIGRRSVSSITVHFTAPHTPYGPIRADGGGLTYVVLRDAVDEGAAWMPQSSSKLNRAIKRRHAISEPIPPSPAGYLAGLVAIVVRAMIPAEDDGLEAAVLSLPPGASEVCRDPRSGGGQFLLVTAGHVVHEGCTLETGSCIHVGENETQFSVAADDGGAEVLFMQFPR